VSLGAQRQSSAEPKLGVIERTKNKNL